VYGASSSSSCRAASASQAGRQLHAREAPVVSLGAPILATYYKMRTNVSKVLLACHQAL
jgi:hypothetical protein